MRGPGREGLPTDPGKGAIECPRIESKADSGSDETSVDVGSRSGLARTSSGRRTSPPSQGVAGPSELPTVGEVLRTAKMLLQPTHAVERQFYADCYRACQVLPQTGRPSGSSSSSEVTPQPYLSSVPEVALRLSCLGHRVVVRRVTDSKQYWSKSMTNLFCYCVLPGTGIGYVLDPGFKEHFRAGRMTDRYRDIWECLPPLFVGPPAKLVQLVQLLCSELQASFESAHRQLPPWRSFSCTINRWMSPVFRDLPVPLRRVVAPPPQAHQQPPSAVAARADSTGGNGSSSSSSSSRSSSSSGSGGSGVPKATPGGVPASTSGGTGMIPAAEAQAFLRACEELVAGTASAPLGSAAAATAAAAARVGPGGAGVGAGTVVGVGVAIAAGRVGGVSTATGAAAGTAPVAAAAGGTAPAAAGRAATHAEPQRPAPASQQPWHLHESGGAVEPYGRRFVRQTGFEAPPAAAAAAHGSVYPGAAPAHDLQPAVAGACRSTQATPSSERSPGLGLAPAAAAASRASGAAQSAAAGPPARGAGIGTAVAAAAPPVAGPSVSAAAGVPVCAATAAPAGVSAFAAAAGAPASSAGYGGQAPGSLGSLATELSGLALGLGLTCGPGPGQGGASEPPAPVPAGAVAAGGRPLTGHRSPAGLLSRSLRVSEPSLLQQQQHSVPQQQKHQPQQQQQQEQQHVAWPSQQPHWRHQQQQ